MDYGLATFDGFHFAHIYARDEHIRLKNIMQKSVDAHRNRA